MACARTARSSLFSTTLPHSNLISRTALSQRRTFLSSGSSVETLHAARTVPYPAKAIYAVVSDVASYSSFLPFCSSSTVTKRSSPDPTTGQEYPEEATLRIGFEGTVSEDFTSRVYCSPAQNVVEAVSGPTAETSLPSSAIDHHSARPSNHDQDPSRQGAVLSHLRTRWQLRPFPFRPGPLRSHESPIEKTGGEEAPPQEQTEVMLEIEYKFASPVYAAMSKAAAPKVAEYMVKAFEQRIRDVLHRPAEDKARVIKS